jgi:hypothetical protein
MTIPNTIFIISGTLIVVCIILLAIATMRESLREVRRVIVMPSIYHDLGPTDPAERRRWEAFMADVLTTETKFQRFVHDCGEVCDPLHLSLTDAEYRKFAEWSLKYYTPGN